MSRDAPDYTLLSDVEITGTEIMVAVDLQGATVAMPIDVQGATIALPVDIQGQTINLDVNLVASEVTIDVNIKAQEVNVNVINPTNWRVATGTPTLLPQTFSETVSANTFDYTVWSASVSEGVRRVERVMIVIYNIDTYWSPYDVWIKVIADGSDVVNYRISDGHYYLGGGYVEAWLSGKSPDLYVIDPPDPAPVKVLWVKTGTTAPTFDGSPWSATTAPDLYAIGIEIDIPFDFTSEAEVRITNPTSVDLSVKGAVFYGIYK